LNIVARARGMSAVAKEAGVTREALYKALGENGDPRLSTLLGVTRALGIQLGAVTVKKRRTAKRAA
jgi:probable addiction module antidote protein